MVRDAHQTKTLLAQGVRASNSDTGGGSNFELDAGSNFELGHGANFVKETRHETNFDMGG